MEHLFSLLTHYGYLILFPLAVVEGPIISVIAGLMCAMKLFDPFIVILVIASGDVIGDSFYYGLGRWQRRTLQPRTLRRFSPSSERIKMVRTYFDANPVRTIFLSKVILGIGLAGLYIAGNAKIPYKKFLFLCLCTSLFQCTVYVIIGYLFGTAYRRIGNLLNGFETFTIMITIAALIIFFIKSRLKKI